MIVNQKFIAQEAGVSQKTVSLYFKERSLIGSKSRDKIAAVVKRHNYFPNAAARSIKLNRFNQIACVMVQYGGHDTANHPHLISYINGASLELARHGYSLMIEPVFVDETTYEVDFPEFFSMRAADGIIGIPGNWVPPEIDKRIAELKLPTVWLNRKSEDPDLNCLLFDEAAGSTKLARHFCDAGIRHIGWFGPEFEEDTVVHYSSRVRFEAVKAEMERHGGSCRSFFCHTGEALDGKARKLLAALSGLDGAVCYNYTYRQTIFVEALVAGVDLTAKRIGHFASMCEFHPCAYEFLDYVVMPEMEMGKCGAEFILKQLRGKDAAFLLEPLIGKLCAQS